MPTVTQPRHWRCIFLSMGETLAPPTDFTVERLLAYDLQAYEQTIGTVHAAAVAELQVQRKLEALENKWTKERFKLGNHIPSALLLIKGRHHLCSYVYFMQFL